jgi:hypothetical protein
MGDAAVAARVKVGQREPHAVGMVGADEGRTFGAASDVDADERHVARLEVGDQRVVVVDPDQDRRIEATVDTDLLGLEQERVVGGLREPARDRRQHLPEEDE